MPISGPVVHQQLMDAYSRVQADLETQRGNIATSSTERDQLFDQRGDALVELAKHYLD